MGMTSLLRPSTTSPDSLLGPLQKSGYPGTGQLVFVVNRGEPYGIPHLWARKRERCCQCFYATCLRPVALDAPSCAPTYAVWCQCSVKSSSGRHSFTLRSVMYAWLRQWLEGRKASNELSTADRGPRGPWLVASWSLYLMRNSRLTQLNPQPFPKLSSPETGPEEAALCETGKCNNTC